MIRFNRTKLDNGLRLIHLYDSATKMVALNLMYNVGAKYESPERTGLAHLMEHLMFTGSANVSKYDDVLQAAGGVSNAWTNSDLTNFYETLPAHNVETAMWVESDRLLALSLSDESIRVQKDVVMEEFKERYLNEPYGDINHMMQCLAYVKHPYMWPTIGKSLDHIADVSRDEIMRFYKSFYSVDNLVMCIAGNITYDDAVVLANKWFGDIAPSGIVLPELPVEPKQTEPRMLCVTRDVPQNMIYRAYHMPGHVHALYPACDLLSDVLSNGKSSRFHQNIMSRSPLLTEVDAAIQGTVEPGLFLVRARLAEGTTFEQAEELIDNEIDKLRVDGVTQYELTKCQNKFHSAMLFDNIGYQEKATKLCEYEIMGDADMFNTEVDRYRATTIDNIAQALDTVFNPNNCSTIYYSKKD